MHFTDLFSSPLAVIDNLYSDPDIAADVAKRLVDELGAKSPTGTMMATYKNNKNVHQHPALQELMAMVEDAGNQYSSKVMQASSKILTCWANVIEDQQHQQYHHHRLNTGPGFAGIYYASVKQQEYITFYSPFQTINEINKSDINLIQVKENRLLLFPSYLAHSFSACSREQPKVSFAFNFGMVRQFNV